MDDAGGGPASAARTATEEWAVPLGERRPTFASIAFGTTRLLLGGPEVVGLWFLFELLVLGGFLVLLSAPSPGVLLTNPSGDWLSALLDAVEPSGLPARLPLLVVAYFILRTPVAGAVAAYGAARQRRAIVRFRDCVRAGFERFGSLLGGSLLLGATVAAILSVFVGGLAAVASSADLTGGGVLTAGFLIPVALILAVAFFYVSSGLSLWAPTAMMEEAGAGASVLRGWRLSAGYRWSIGGAYLVLESLAWALSWILLAFAGYLASLDVFRVNLGLFELLVAAVVAIPLLGVAFAESFFTLGAASAYNLILASEYTQAAEEAGAFEPPSGFGSAASTIARRP